MHVGKYWYFILVFSFFIILFPNNLYSVSKETEYRPKYGTIAHKIIYIEADSKPVYKLRSKIYKKIGLFDEALKDIKKYESFN